MPWGFEVPKAELKNLARRQIVLCDQRFKWNSSGQLIHEGFSNEAKSEGIMTLTFGENLSDLMDQFKTIMPQLEQLNSDIPEIFKNHYYAFG